MNAHDDDIARRLRAALAREASTVKISGDGLQKIRARTSSGRVKVRFPWLQGPALAAMTLAIGLLVGVGAGFLLAGPNETFRLGPVTFGEETPSPSPTETPPPPTSTPTPGRTDAPPPLTTYAAPVYWLGDIGGRLALYREFVSVKSQGAHIRDAVTAMLSGNRADPDYVTVWPEGTTVLGVTPKDGVVTVDLSLKANATHAPPETAQISLQQLVWTVTAAAREANLKVLLKIEGKLVDDLWESGVSATEPIGRARSIDVLAPVWIIGPEHGTTVGRTFTLKGVATVFEATVSIEVRRNGEVVTSTFATASEGAPGRGTWEKTLTLEPGTYEIRAFESSAEDGRPLFVDSKVVTVR